MPEPRDVVPASADRPARLTLAGFAAAVQREVFDADRGLFGTWWRLWWRPGATLRRYIEWRDPALTPPVRYAIVALALAALLLHSLGISAEFAGGFEQGLAKANHASAQESGWAAAIGERLDWWLYLAAIPAMAAALENVYRRHINTAEALAFATYALAQIALGIALLIVLLDLAFGYAGTAPFALWPIYFAAACRAYFVADGFGAVRAAGAAAVMLAYLGLFTLALALGAIALARAFG
jgi:hypothetical protein